MTDNQTPPGAESSLADRFRWAYRCLPVDDLGRPPKQADLARAAGVPESTVSRLLNDGLASVSVDTLARLARVMDVTMDWLGAGIGEAPSPQRQGQP